MWMFDNFILFLVAYDKFGARGNMPQLHLSIYLSLHIFFLISLSITQDGETQNNRNGIQIRTADYLRIFIISATIVCQGPRPNLE